MHLKNVYSPAVVWNVLYMLKSIYSRVRFNSNISLLIFCLDDLSVADSGIMKFVTLTALSSISPLVFA